MWYQLTDPLHSTLLSASVAAVPIFFLFGLLVSRRISGHFATLLTLVLAVIIATTFFSMPPELAGMAALFGMANGLFPIGWIVLSAVFLYNISVQSGGFAVVRDSIESITPDRRLQALLIAFCFGAFLEGAAGFGAPVAITAGMLVGLGFDALYAAGICLVANTAPVAFGGIGIAVITAGNISNIDPAILSKMIGHQLPFIAFIMPLWLVLIISGWRGAREIWPAILVTGASYALTMYLTASFVGPTLPDILAAIASISCLIGLLQFWTPRTIWRFPSEQVAAAMHPVRAIHSSSDLIRAWTPFLLLIIFVGNWGSAGIQHLLSKFTLHIPFGFLDNAISTSGIGGSTLSVTYHFAWLGAAGTAIFFAAILTALLLGLPLRRLVVIAADTVRDLHTALVTIAAIVGFAYVANYSGMSASLGNALTATGWIFPFLSPLLGWVGVFITGSDTSSNALFSNVQAQTARSLSISPVLTVASNSSGGVAAKMISPQSIAVGAASAKLTGQEGALFRFTLPHSIGLILIICSVVFIQAYFARWMIPAEAARSVADASTKISVLETGIVATSIIAILMLALPNLRYRARTRVQ